jgi:hypothetical protein
MEINTKVTSSPINTKKLQDSMVEVSKSKPLQETVVEDIKRIQVKLEDEMKTSQKISELTGQGSLLNILA